MQSRLFVGPFGDRNPDYTGVGWAGYGASTSHVDSDDTTGWQANDLAGGESLAHVMAFDDGSIPRLATIEALRVVYRLGDAALTTQGALPVVPYSRYEGGAPVFQEQILTPHLAAFADYPVVFPRDPDGLPWTRQTIFSKHDRLLLFGLRSAHSDLLSAQVLWSECRFGVDFLLPAPVVTTDPASLISATTALLNGRLDPRSANASYPLMYWFDYGTTTAYGLQTTPVANVVGDAVLTIAVPLSGLSTGVGYHFRLAASNADGTYYGKDHFFTTDPTATGRWRLDEFKRVPTGTWLAGDRTRMTSRGFDRPSTSTDDLSCPFLEYP